MKNTIKRILCTVLVVVMCITAIPLQGFVGLDWQWSVFSVAATSATETYDYIISIDYYDHYWSWLAHVEDNTYLPLFVESNKDNEYADIVYSIGNSKENVSDSIDVIIAGSRSSKSEYIETIECSFNNRIEDISLELAHLEQGFLYIDILDTQYTINGFAGISMTVKEKKPGETSYSVILDEKIDEENLEGDSSRIKLSYDIGGHGNKYLMGNIYCKSWKVTYNFETNSGPLFPDGYNFETDGWQFVNQTLEIGSDKYTAIHGPVAGGYLYSTACLAAAFDSSYVGEKGTCFGMATTTGYVLDKNLSVSSLNYNSVQASNMSDARNGEHGTDPWNISELDMSVSDFIQYAHLTQYSGELVVEQLYYNNKLEELIKAVKNYVNGGESIVISYDDHTVFPCGFEEDKEGDTFTIYVDDSNENSTTERKRGVISIGQLGKEGEYWYGTSGNTYGNSDITFCYAPEYLKTYLTPDTKIQSNYLTFITSKKINDISTDLYEIRIRNGISDSKSPNIYCIEKGDVVQFKATEEDYIIISDRESAIEFGVSEGIEVKASVDDLKHNNIEISGSNKCDVKFVSHSDGSIIKCSIAGIASTDDITATQTETGLLVTGISDGTVTLTKDDEVIETKEITDAVGEIEITYDKNGEDEEVELDYHSHSYTSAITTPSTHLTEGVETFTCSCGDSYTKPVAKLEEHTYTSKVTTPATHLTEGVETFTCSCGDSYTKPVAKLKEHTYVASDVVAPSCEKGGYTVYTCECGHSYNGDKTSATGHSYVEGVCSACGESKVDNCSCNCHKTGFMGFIWKIINLFNKLFKMNKTCGCGVSHY